MIQKKQIASYSIIAFLVLTSLIVYSIYSNPELYPVKSAFCTWAADTRIINRNNGPSEIQQLNIQKHLLPGDIVISQNSWYLSTFGIPGFWTHAAVYIGTLDERKAFFDNDPGFSTWVKRQGLTNNNFEQFLAPKNHHNNTQKKKENEQVIIEARSEGVVLSTFKKFSSKDAIAVLRPRLSKTEIANAIQVAYSLLDSPYDFDFNFKTDTAIACTELVYRMYEDVKIIPANQLMSKPFTTSNDIARFFDETYGTSKQNLDLVMVYIDDITFFTIDNLGLNEFRSSWKRSMWDF